MRISCSASVVPQVSLRQWPNLIVFWNVSDAERDSRVDEGVVKCDSRFYLRRRLVEDFCEFVLDLIRSVEAVGPFVLRKCC